MLAAAGGALIYQRLIRQHTRCNAARLWTVRGFRSVVRLVLGQEFLGAVCCTLF
jgi:hypothetical protein